MQNARKNSQLKKNYRKISLSVALFIASISGYSQDGNAGAPIEVA
jgi:hypothetical protein